MYFCNQLDLFFCTRLSWDGVRVAGCRGRGRGWVGERARGVRSGRGPGPPSGHHPRTHLCVEYLEPSIASAGTGMVLAAVGSLHYITVHYITALHYLLTKLLTSHYIELHYTTFNLRAESLEHRSHRRRPLRRPTRRRGRPHVPVDDPDFRVEPLPHTARGFAWLKARGPASWGRGRAGFLAQFEARPGLCSGLRRGARCLKIGYGGCLMEVWRNFKSAARRRV